MPRSAELTPSADLFSPGFFRRLQQLKLRTKRSFLGSRQGAHLSYRRGHGLEFSDFRPYTHGDDYRHIDWGVYGRTDRVYVREFRAEQDLSVFVVIDGSASMGFPAGEGKFEMARAIALSLGYIGLADGDSVTYATLGHGLSPRYSGPKALGRMISDLGKIEPAGNIDMTATLRAGLARQKIPGRCFVISDFMFPKETQVEMLNLLLAKNFEVSLVQVLSPGELHLSLESAEIVVDSETGEEFEVVIDDRARRQYAADLDRHVKELVEYSHRCGMAHVLVSSGERVEDVILKRFSAAGIVK